MSRIVTKGSFCINHSRGAESNAWRSCRRRGAGSSRVFVFTSIRPRLSSALPGRRRLQPRLSLRSVHRSLSRVTARCGAGVTIRNRDSPLPAAGPRLGTATFPRGRAAAWLALAPSLGRKVSGQSCRWHMRLLEVFPPRSGLSVSSRALHVDCLSPAPARPEAGAALLRRAWGSTPQARGHLLDTSDPSSFSLTRVLVQPPPVPENHRLSVTGW